MKYIIEEGYDYHKGIFIYRVKGIDNEYVGEWGSLRKDIENEIRELDF